MENEKENDFWRRWLTRHITTEISHPKTDFYFGRNIILTFINQNRISFTFSCWRIINSVPLLPIQKFIFSKRFPHGKPYFCSHLVVSQNTCMCHLNRNNSFDKFQNETSEAQNKQINHFHVTSLRNFLFTQINLIIFVSRFSFSRAFLCFHFISRYYDLPVTRFTHNFDRLVVVFDWRWNIFLNILWRKSSGYHRTVFSHFDKCNHRKSTYKIRTIKNVRFRFADVRPCRMRERARVEHK